jgi:dihydrofolate reductase
MRNLILQEFVTLDGLAAGPEDSVDFVPLATRGDQSFGREQLAFIDGIGALVLGRITYQLFASDWPGVDQGDETPFADRFNAARKVVFSKTLDRAPWGDWGEARVLKTSPAPEVADLKAQTGKDIAIFGRISVTDRRGTGRRLSTGGLPGGAGKRPLSLRRRRGAVGAPAVGDQDVRSRRGAPGVRPDPGGPPSA